MKRLQQQYTELLEQYLQQKNEKALYYAQQFSRRFIEKEVAPEEVVSIHKEAHLAICPKKKESVEASYDFLIEMMIHYGLALREHQSMVKEREKYQYEIEVAADVQRTLLKTGKPFIEGLEIGYITEAASKMSGDYVYFSQGEHQIGVAVADVIGKGVPAALCMSMIKFGMDSATTGRNHPHDVLTTINRTVEKSISDMMFISMFYGTYDSRTATFTYGSAGHEPALLYRAETEQVELLDAKGLLLGVHPVVTYEEQQVVLQEGDFIAIMTDGVTEAKVDEQFITDEQLQEMLIERHQLPAQQMAEELYNQLMQAQNFELRDDFTVVILKKVAA